MASETGTARKAAEGRIEQIVAETMPHHIIAVTSGPAATDAGRPAG